MNARQYFLAVSALFFSLTAFAEIKIHNIQNATSATACDGKISIFIDGSSNGPYEIQLFQSTKTVATLSNKENGVHTFDSRCVGNYTIKVIDKNSKLSGGAPTVCVKTLTATISFCADNAIEVGIQKSTLVCDGSKDGFIDITPQGGTPPYKYAWNIGKTTEDLNDLDGDKTYKVTVTDNQGCKAIREIKVDGQKINTTLTLVEGNTNTQNCNGQIRLEYILITGIQSPTSPAVEWNTPKIKNNTFPIIGKDLCSGFYSAKITTAEGCSITKEVEVVNCNKPKIYLYNDRNVGCRNIFPVYIDGINLWQKFTFIFEGPNNYSYERKHYEVRSKIGENNIVNLPVESGNNGQYKLTIIDEDCKTQTTLALELEIKCDCALSKAAFESEYSWRTDEFKCDVNSGKAKLGIGIRYGKLPKEVLGFRKFTINWPDNSPNYTTIQGSFGNHEQWLHGIKGPEEEIIKSSGSKIVRVRDDHGCLFEYCFDFGEVGSLPFCKQKIDKLSSFYNKKYPVTKDYLDWECNHSDVLDVFCPHKETSCSKLGKEIGWVAPENNSIYPSTKKLNYLPANYDAPCSNGKIIRQCDAQKDISGGVMFVDWSSRKPSAVDGFCEYQCACFFESSVNGYSVYVENVKYIKESELCSKVFINDLFEPASPISPSTPNPCYKDSDNLKKCSGGKHIYTDDPSYNDCFFDVTCPDKNNPGETLLIYENCPFRFTCCYKYDDIALLYPEKEKYFPNYAVFGQGQNDLVRFCRWQHQNGFPDKAKNHVIEVIAKGSCNNSKSCADYFSQDNMSKQQGGVKFIQVDEAYAEVYPNPFEQTIDFRLYHNKGKIINIVLYDVLGRLIQTKDIDTINGNISFSMNVKEQLPKGMYIVVLEGEGFRLQYPLVHQ